MTPVTFHEHPPSTAWEILPIPDVDGARCWAWFRPQHLPFGAVVNVPPEVARTPDGALLFSLFQLAHALGLPWENLAAVSLYGREWQPADLWQAMGGDPLPAPIDPANTQIMLMTQNATLAIPETSSMTSAPVSGEVVSPSAATTNQFNRLESEWRACQGLERQLSGLRKQLSAVLGRLGTMDRDLRPEENLAADRLDKDEWLDARRWIREAASKVHKCIKAHDIGATSAAGRRGQIEQRYEQTADNPAAAGDLTACLHELEVYRRELGNLLNSMGSALQGANTNGIQRAQRILSKIAAKARKKRAKDRG